MREIEKSQDFILCDFVFLFLLFINFYSVSILFCVSLAELQLIIFIAYIVCRAKFIWNILVFENAKMCVQCFFGGLARSEPCDRLNC